MNEEIKSSESSRLKDVALAFFKLGTTAFGGPAAHIAMMEEEFVRRRKWISEAQFLDFLGIANLIPGPNSTEMAIHIGYERAGKRGLVVAGVCFIVPAMMIVLAIAWGYSIYGKIPEVQSIFYGMKPIILAVIAQAVWNLSLRTAKRRGFLLVTIASAFASLCGIGEVSILVLAGALAVACVFIRGGDRSQTKSVLSLFAIPLAKPLIAASALTVLIPFSNTKLFLFFLKVGSVLYGSGYVLLSFLQTELVDHYGWLTQAQLLDATAVGQFTPGPVFTTATFIGYLLSGVSGAMLATLGIFLPSFFFVGFSAKLIPWMKKSLLTGGFLNGVNAASLGLMAAVTVRLGREALIDLTTVALGIVSAFILIRWKPNSVWLLLAGGVIGYFQLRFDG